MTTERDGTEPRVRLRADPAAATKRASPTPVSLFYEDPNRFLDGGLNANQVANHSFEGTYLHRRPHNEFIAMAVKRAPCRLSDPLRYWCATRGSLDGRTDNAIRAGGTYARLSTDHGVTVVCSAPAPAPAGMGWHHADVAARHPGIRVVLSARPFSRCASFDQAWECAAGHDAPLIVDDSHPRHAATVRVGECAAHPPTSGIGKRKDSRPTATRKS